MLERLAAALAPGLAIETGTGAEAIEEDTRRLTALLDGDEFAMGLRLWTNSQCLVTSRRFAAMKDFAVAAASSAAAGWPVHARSSGGTTVAHRPGMLNVSRFTRFPNGDVDISGEFRDFCQQLVASLRSIGFFAGLGSVPESYCDGRFNIVIDGRKVAGTASLARSKVGILGLLSHATISVSGDVAEDVKAIDRFETALDVRTRYSISAHATLEQFCSSSDSPGDTLALPL